MTRYVKVNNELGKWEKREITNEIIGSNHTKELAEDKSYEKESSRKSTRPTASTALPKHYFIRLIASQQSSCIHETDVKRRQNIHIH